MIIRKIQVNDFYKNYLNLINQFTRNPEQKTYNEFSNILQIIEKQNSHIFVIEYNNIIVGTAKVIIEQKLHNNFKCMGHIEDVVVLENYRNKGLGKMLTLHCIEFCKNNNCYKTILDCNPNNIEFYKKIGFIEKGAEMCIYH